MSNPLTFLTQCSAVQRTNVFLKFRLVCASAWQNVGKALRFSWRCLLTGLQSMASAIYTPTSAMAVVVTEMSQATKTRWRRLQQSRRDFHVSFFHLCYSVIIYCVSLVLYMHIYFLLLFSSKYPLFNLLSTYSIVSWNCHVVCLCL